MESGNPVHGLSFVKRRSNESLDFWAVPEKADREVGWNAAEELIKYAQQYQAPMVLGHVISRISELQRATGEAERAFFSRIMIAAIA